MKKIRKHIYMLLLLLTNFIWAQDVQITYSNPIAIEICGEEVTYEVTISNNSGSILDTNSLIEFKLPEGVEYVNSTVSSNFNDSSVTDNNHPIFTANEQVQVNSQLILQFNGVARCEAYSNIDDNDEAVNNKIKYSYAIGGVIQPEVFINDASIFDDSVTDSYNLSFRDVNIFIQPDISGQQNQTLVFNNTYQILQQQVDVSVRDHSLNFSEFSINITPDSELQFMGVSDIIIDGTSYNSSGVTITGTNPIEVTFDAESIGINDFTALMNINIIFDYRASSCFLGDSQHVVYESIINCINGSSCSRGIVNGDFEFQQLDPNVSLDFTITDNQHNICGDTASVSLTLENDVNALSPIYNVRLFLFENLGANITNIVIDGVSVAENDYISTSAPGVLLQQSIFTNLQDLDGNGLVDLAPGNSITVTCDVEMTLPPELSDIENCQSNYNSSYFNSSFYYNNSECDDPFDTDEPHDFITVSGNNALRWQDLSNSPPVLNLDADINEGESTQVQFCIDRIGRGGNNLFYDNGVMLSAQVEIPCGIQINADSVTFTDLDGTIIPNEFIDIQTSVIEEKTIADIILLQPSQVQDQGNYGGCFNFEIQLDCDIASNCSNLDQSLVATAYGNFPECPDLKMNLGCETKNLILHCLPQIGDCPSPLALVTTDFVVTRTTYGTTDDDTETQITIEGVDDGTFTGLNTKGAYACDSIRTEIIGSTACDLENETLFAYTWYDHPENFPFLTPTGATVNINGVIEGSVTSNIALRPDLSSPTLSVFEIQVSNATVNITDILKVTTSYTVDQTINNTRSDNPNTIPDFPEVFSLSQFRGELRLTPRATNGGIPTPSSFNHGDDFEVYGLDYRASSFSVQQASCGDYGAFRPTVNVFGGTMGDDFPNEFRNVIQFAGPIDVSVPDGINIISVRYDGHVPSQDLFLSTQDLGGGVFRIIDNDYVGENNFRPFDKISNTTYHYLTIRLGLSDCSIDSSQEISANLSYIEQAYIDGACRDIVPINPPANPVIISNGSGFGQGDLNLDIVNPIFQSIEATTRYKININNNNNSKAFYPWIKFTYPNNLIHVENAPAPYGYDVVGEPIVDPGTNTTTLFLRLNSINGGEIKQGHIDVSLNCEESGELAEIQIETGISCLAIEDDILEDTSTLCTLDTNKKVELEIVKSNLLMDVIPLFDTNVSLESCEEFQYLVQISNNELANITNPIFQIDVPAGLSMSAQYRYPVTEIVNTVADFSNTGFSSPVTITNGSPWALEGTNGVLPGFRGNTTVHNNYYQILITLTPSCDYNGVDKIHFQTNGITNCNEPADVPPFVTTPNIAGLEMLEEYSPELAITVNQNGTCGNYTANITYHSDTNISEDAVLTISLPSELSSTDPLTFDLPITGTANFTFNFTANETYCEDTPFDYSISIDTTLTCGAEECTSNFTLEDSLITNVCCTVGNCAINPSMTIINGSENDCEDIPCNMIIGLNTSTAGNANTVINEAVWNIYDINNPTIPIYTETGTLGHEFEDGTYIVSMTITGVDTENNVSCDETIYETVTISCNNCSTSFEVSYFPHSALDGNCLTFDLLANNVNITNGTFVNYEWIVNDESGNQVASFSDTVIPTSQEVTVPAVGNYTAILTVNTINDSGIPCSTSQEVSFATTCMQCTVNANFDVFRNRTDPCNSPTIVPNTSITIGTYFGYEWTVTDSNGNIIHTQADDTVPQELDFVFPSSGDYLVCLKVIGESAYGEECIDSFCNNVTIICPNCNIEGSLDVESQTAQDGPCNGFDITPNISINTGVPLDYTWMLYDTQGNSLGVISSGNGLPSTLSYLTPSNDDYTICLELRSTSIYGDICTSIICETLENNCSPCNVNPDFTFTVSKCNASFTNLIVANGASIQCLWDFGDGTTSTEINPTHVYASNGIYDVILIASYTNGAEVCTANIGPKKVAVLDCNSSELLKGDAETLKVYPNPNKGLFRLEVNEICESCTIEVFNPSGQLIFESKLNKSNQIDIDISDKSNGVYLVKLTNGEEEKVKRVIVNQ